jgi:hypothetical protein
MKDDGARWPIDGERLIAMSDNMATIEPQAGARQTWHRRDSNLGQMPPSQLGDGEDR